jgi:hypothetical protein
MCGFNLARHTNFQFFQFSYCMVLGRSPDDLVHPSFYDQKGIPLRVQKQVIVPAKERNYGDQEHCNYRAR